MSFNFVDLGIRDILNIRSALKHYIKTKKKDFKPSYVNDLQDLLEYFNDMLKDQINKED